MEKVSNLVGKNDKAGVMGSSAFVIPVWSKWKIRRSKSLWKLGKSEDALKEIVEVLKWDEKNTEAKNLEQAIIKELERTEVEKMKENAAECLKKEEI